MFTSYSTVPTQLRYYGDYRFLYFLYFFMPAIASPFFALVPSRRDAACLFLPPIS